MVRSASLFSQPLQHLPRIEFAALVKKHGAERGSKGFTCWTQCVAMLFCHLAHADSLREICNGLSCYLGKLNHVGIEKAPKKATLAYANRHRHADLYESLFWSLLGRFRAHSCSTARLWGVAMHHQITAQDLGAPIRLETDEAEHAVTALEMAKLGRLAGPFGTLLDLPI